MYLQVIPFEDEDHYFKHSGHDSGLDLGHAPGVRHFVLSQHSVFSLPLSETHEYTNSLIHQFTNTSFHVSQL